MFDCHCIEVQKTQYKKFIIGKKNNLSIMYYWSWHSKKPWCFKIQIDIFFKFLFTILYWQIKFFFIFLLFCQDFIIWVFLGCEVFLLLILTLNLRLKLFDLYFLFISIQNVFELDDIDRIMSHVQILEF